MKVIMIIYTSEKLKNILGCRWLNSYLVTDFINPYKKVSKVTCEINTNIITLDKLVLELQETYNSKVNVLKI
jgi:hypothetical protein